MGAHFTPKEMLAFSSREARPTWRRTRRAPPIPTRCASIDEQRRCPQSRGIFERVATSLQKKTHWTEVQCVLISYEITLGGADVFRARALGTLSWLEGYLLPFLQLIERCALDRGHVEKQVLARTCVDESKSLVSESLDSTLSHFVYSFFVSTRPDPSNVLGGPQT